MKSRFQLQDSEHLQSDQYRDSSNLNARADLHRRFSTNSYGWHQWVSDQINLQAGERLLECGCGPGMLWADNLARIPPGCRLVLTDLSEGMVAEASATVSGSGHDFLCRQANIESLPFETASFHVVVANHMLYHVPNLDKALSEVRRVLRPSGRFLAATNGLDHMQELLQMGQELLSSQSARSFSPPLQMSVASAFGLENGASLLRPWFRDVSLWRYEDSLEVTEVEPLLAYVTSSSFAKTNLTEEMLGRISAYVRQIIADQGAFRITKSSGIFVARPTIRRDDRTER